MIKKFLFIVFLFAFLASWSQKNEGDIGMLRLKKGLEYKVLFQSGDTVTTISGKLKPSKENLDCNILLVQNEVQLFTSNETKDSDSTLGLGGGGILMDLNYQDGWWDVKSIPKEIDFSPVGGTINNCGGKLGWNNKIWIAEEYVSDSKVDLFKIFHDSTDFQGIGIEKNFGWIVEIDPESGKATKKIQNFGRFSHEDVLVLDNRNVLLTNDYFPAFLYKYVAENDFDTENGQLYVFSESNWQPIPMDEMSLLDPNSYALQMGATAFVRLEWMTRIGEKIYITETGHDDVSVFSKMQKNTPSYRKGIILKNDYHGRVLELDLKHNSIKVVVEGGEIGKYHFSNPDCITSVKLNNRDFLVINEDINSVTEGRSENGEILNDVFLFDIEKKKMSWVLTAPRGAETTGGIFDQYGNYLLNIQHPNSENPKPFNRSSLIQIKGISK